MIMSLASLLIAAGIGWCVVGALWPTRDIALKGPLALALGLTITSFHQLAVLVLGLGNLAVLAGLDLIVLAGAAGWFVLISRRRNAHDTTSDSRITLSRSDLAVQRLLMAACGVAVILAAAATVLMAAAAPYGQWDAWAIWNLKAAFFFRDPQHWTRAFDSVIAWSHTDYPLLLPLTVARLWQYAGQESALLSGATSWMFTMLTICLLFAAVRHHRGATQAAIAAAALIATIAFIEQGAQQIADVPVGLYLLASLSVVALAGHSPNHRTCLYILAGLFAGSASWTKNEGMLMALAIVVAVAASISMKHGLNRAGRDTAALLMGLAPMLAVVFTIKALFGGPSDLMQDQSWPLVLERVGDWSRHRQVLTAGAHTMWSVPGPMLLLALVIYAGSARLHADPIPRYAALTTAVALVLIILGFYFVYLLTPRDLAWQLNTSAHRLFIQLWPSALLTLFIAARSPLETWRRAGAT